MGFRAKKVFLSILLSCASALALAEQTLNVSLMFSSGEQRETFLHQIRKFESSYPEISVMHNEVEQERYKKSIESWLQTENGTDVYYWFAGNKLREFVEKGLVQNIDDIWSRRDWDRVFTGAARNAVSHEGKVYGLPLSYYQWGFYYSKSTFERAGVKPPTNWRELIQVCDKLKLKGITPFALGSKYKWTAAGWFDYLNLRINGLEYHRDLMQGKVSYDDTGVREVFEHWRLLVDNGYFLKNHAELDWRQALPYLYWGKAGMVLMGNFLGPKIPDRKKSDIGFFPFPSVHEPLPRYEEAPMDVLVIPKHAKNREAAELFLGFMSQASTQFEMNEKMGMISPNVFAPTGTDPLILAGTKLLSEASGLSQFYDRDTSSEMHPTGMQGMVDFLANPKDLDDILKTLEQKRADIWGSLEELSSR